MDWSLEEGETKSAEKDRDSGNIRVAKKGAKLYVNRLCVQMTELEYDLESLEEADCLIVVMDK